MSREASRAAFTHPSALLAVLADLARLTRENVGRVITGTASRAAGFTRSRLEFAGLANCALCGPTCGAEATSSTFQAGRCIAAARHRVGFARRTREACRIAPRARCWIVCASWARFKGHQRECNACGGDAFRLITVATHRTRVASACTWPRAKASGRARRALWGASLRAMSADVAGEAGDAAIKGRIRATIARCAGSARIRLMAAGLALGALVETKRP